MSCIASLHRLPRWMAGLALLACCAAGRAPLRAGAAPRRSARAAARGGAAHAPQRARRAGGEYRKRTWNTGASVAFAVRVW